MSRLSVAELPQFAAQTPPDSEACDHVCEMMLKYTKDMAENAKQGNVDEVKYIHQPTFQLMRALVKYRIPEYEVQFFEKGSGDAVSTTYNTVLVTSKGPQHVSGETDLLICVGDVPVGNVEVKNLTMTCATTNEEAQILVEGQSFAEKYRQRAGMEPRLFPSVLVSGRRWVFVDRRFRDGEDRYLVFPALNTFSDETVGEGGTCVVDLPSVTQVSQMLLRMVDAMEVLIKDMVKKRKQDFDVYGPNGDEDIEEESDGSSGESSDREDDTGPVNGPRPPTAPGRDRTSTVPVASSKAKGKGCDRGGGKGGGRGGGGSKQKKSAKSNMTKRNMCLHDLNTIWHV